MSRDEELRPTERLDREPAELRALRERLARSQVCDVLRPLLSEEPPRGLLEELEIVNLRPGERLFEADDPADALYVVIDGRLRRDGDDRGTTEAVRGDLIGASGVLRRRRRRDTVTAVRESQLVRIGKAQLGAWSIRFPAFLLAIAGRVIAQVESAGERPRACRVLALIRHRDVEPVQALVHGLPDALHRHGRALVLTAQAFEARFDGLVTASVPSSDADHQLVARALAELEVHHDVLVLVADAAPTEWTRRCLDRADTVVVVADATDDPSPGRLEALAAEEAPGRPVELVLLHPSATQEPSGTARWLDPPERFERHHHLRRGERRHLLSLARRLTGRAIGLVLSGGGARGYAHVGVWRAILESGVDVDHFGGTSMGALLAAAFAMGIPYDEAMRLSARMTNPRRLFDFTLPVAALFRSKKLHRFVTELYGERQIEDLWTPFFCMACNLTTAERLLIRRGSLAAAIRASISIPGVFTPVIIDGQLVVDGGVMDNFPVDVMRAEARSERIIAVNVAPPVLKSRTFDIVDHVSGWWVLARRLSPFAKSPRVPPLGATLMRSLEVNSARSSLEQRTRAHLLLEPSVKSVGILDFARYERAAEIGYETARGRIYSWASEHAPTVFPGEPVPEAWQSGEWSALVSSDGR